MDMKAAESLGKRISPLLQQGEINQAYELLAPVLAKRTRFPHLQRIGKTFGSGTLEEVNPFLEKIASQKTEGGFEEARHHLEGWRESPNAWVRRSVGVAVHFWTKRSGGEPATIPFTSSANTLVLLGQIALLL